MPVPSSKDKEETRKKDEADNNEGIQRERNMIIEAHCVKQMKAHKTMLYNDLMQKVMATIQNFKAQPAQIKLRIQHLIENDYMERDKDNKAKLIYIP
jgi:hypothetical protein